MKKIAQPIKFGNVLFPGGVGFSCKQCGECCIAEPADINEEEYKAIIAKGFRDFADSDKHGFKVIRRGKNGGCFFLTAHNKCAVHDVKPATCRITPFIPTNYDFSTKTITLKSAAKAVSIVGCKGICKGQLSEQDKKEIAEAAQTVMDDLLKMIAEKEGIPINSEKAARIANKIIQQ